MGQINSKDKLLYEQVNYGNVAGIKALREGGAGIEWVDRDGKTPLILACMKADLLPVAKLLLELGANVNAYRPGRFAGTALHHAAKRGLDQTASLLLSHGANPLSMNDDCQTALDLAREKGHCNVIRLIENRISLFSGWLREYRGSSILGTLIPQLFSVKIWAVVLPCDSRNLSTPSKFELIIYPDLKVAKPRTIIALHKAQVEQPKFSQSDPLVVVEDVAGKTRYRFSSANEGDVQQLQQFYIACKGNNRLPSDIATTPIQVQNDAAVQINVATSNLARQNPCSLRKAAPAAQTPDDDSELALAIKASIQSAIAEGVPLANAHRPHPSIYPCSSSDGQGISAASEGGSIGAPSTTSFVGSSSHEVAPVVAPVALLPPSAPPLLDDDDLRNVPVCFPRDDLGPIDHCGPATSVSSCVICLDAQVEGACIPCGHMAGCMACLKEIESKKWGCPVCRSRIDQVVRLYAV